MRYLEVRIAVPKRGEAGASYVILAIDPKSDAPREIVLTADEARALCALLAEGAGRIDPRARA